MSNRLKPFERLGKHFHPRPQRGGRNSWPITDVASEAEVGSSALTPKLARRLHQLAPKASFSSTRMSKLIRCHPDDSSVTYATGSRKGRE